MLMVTIALTANVNLETRKKKVIRKYLWKNKGNKFSFWSRNFQLDVYFMWLNENKSAEAVEYADWISTER